MTDVCNPADRFEYVFAPRYLYNGAGLHAESAAKIVAKCVASLARDFEAWPVGYPTEASRGTLPQERAQKDEVIEAIWGKVRHWWRTYHPEMADYELVGLVLLGELGLILDQHDGIPARLFLRENEFQTVQVCLTRNGLPGDLYELAPRR